MSDIAIRVENLSKLYHIGALRQRDDTLRDALTGLFRRSQKGAQPDDDTNLWALKDVSFEVKRGEVVGIVGRNGAGKSTLLKILSRITEPTSGHAEIHGRVGSLLEVGTDFHPELTGRENIYMNGAILGMRRSEIDRQFDEIVAFAEIERFLDTPVKRYSSGMHVRLAFAVAAHLEPEILLVDEVLAVGDVEFQRKCLGKMEDVAQGGRTVIFVSHNMAAVKDLCQRAFLLKEGELEFVGSVDATIRRYLETQRNDGEVRFDNAPLVRAKLEQKEDLLILEADYCLPGPIDLPCLGFVVSDFIGNRLCGSNPRLSEKLPPSIPKSAGRVTSVIEQPKLVNGIYRLSLWFGDSRQDMFEALDCITFEVVNMAGPKQIPMSAAGSVLPLCKWYFD